MLLGGCVAAEAGQKSLRLPIGKGSLTLSIQNHFDGGSLRAMRRSTVVVARGLRHWTPAGTASTAAPIVPVWTMATTFAKSCWR